MIPNRSIGPPSAESGRCASAIERSLTVESIDLRAISGLTRMVALARRLLSFEALAAQVADFMAAGLSAAAARAARPRGSARRAV